jgi:hypothetical protein
MNLARNVGIELSIENKPSRFSGAITTEYSSDFDEYIASPIDSTTRNIITFLNAKKKVIFFS